MTPLQEQNPASVVPVATPVVPVAVTEISARLVKGAEFIRVEWPKVQKGEPREGFDKLLLLWLDVMQDYYHAGTAPEAKASRPRRKVAMSLFRAPHPRLEQRPTRHDEGAVH